MDQSWKVIKVFFSDIKLSISATFIMACAVPPGVGGSLGIHDLCWLDVVTLVIAQLDGMQVLKVTVDTHTKTCNYSVIDSGYRAHRVSCSPDGQEVYVVDDTRHSIWVYYRDGNRKGGEWKPEGLMQKSNTIAIDRDKIVVSAFGKGPSFVYNRNKELLYRIKVDGDRYQLWYTFLAPDFYLVATTGSHGHRLIIYNMIHNTSLTVGGQGTSDGKLNMPAGVCIVGDGILVSDTSNDRVSVFSLRGEFLHHVQFEGDGVNSPGAIAFTSGKHLLAVITDFEGLRVYSLMTWGALHNKS